MNRRSFVVATVAALCLVLTGCGKRAVSRHPSSPNPPPARKVRLAVIADSRSRAELAVRAGCNRAAADLPNITLDFQYPVNPDAPTQNRIIDDLLARATDGIAISPVDGIAQESALTEAARQTLLFTRNNDAPQSGRTCFVGPDQIAAGWQMAAVVRELLPGGGRVLVYVGTPGDRAALDRLLGLRQTLEKGKFTLLDLATPEADFNGTFPASPVPFCLVALAPDGGPFLLRALRATDEPPPVKIVASDAEPETLQGIRDGAVAASVVEQPFEIGRQTLITMNRVLNGDRSAVPPGKRLLVPCLVLRRDSVDAYAASLQALPAH